MTHPREIAAPTRLADQRSCAWFQAIAMACLVGCKSTPELLPDPTMVRIAPAEVQNLNATEATLVFPVEVTNPYDSDLTLTRIHYDLRSKGERVASDRVRTREVVGPRASRIIRVPVRFRLSELEAGDPGEGQPGAMAPFEADLAVQMEVAGYAPVEVPIRSTGEVPLSPAPELSLESIEWHDLSLSRAAATLKLHVWNRNEFPIDLSRMSYSLILSDVPVVRSSLAEPVSMAPGSDKTVDLKASFSPQRFGAAFLDILMGSEATYELAGTMSLATPFGKMDLPYRKSGKTIFQAKSPLDAGSPSND